MSLIFGDPCGSFYSTTAQAIQGLWQALNATIHTSGLPAGNIGPTALTIGNAGGNITVPLTAGPYIIGFRVCFTTSIGTGTVCTFNSASGTQGTVQLNGNGTFSVYRGPLSALLGTSSGAVTISQNVWAYVELQYGIGTSTGAFGVRINGVSVLQSTGNTEGDNPRTTIDHITIGSNITMYVQDLVITDSNGTYNNTYLGDVSLSVYNPTGTGTAGLNQYTANGAATVWQSTNATTPADSSIFASDFTPGDRMSNTLATTSVTGTIAGLVHVSRVKKDSSGTRTLAQTITSNGHDAVGATKAPGTTYAYFTQISETDPNTALPWTQSGFNSVQAGLETVA